MRIEINSGGLDSFFNGVSSFINSITNNNSASGLIKSFQNVANKTSNISGGVGTLGVALEYINTRKAIEEGRKLAVETVQRKTNNFIQTAKSVDRAVAQIVSSSTESFYRVHPWLRPPVPPNSAEEILRNIGKSTQRFFGDVAEWAGNAWNGVVGFVKENWVAITAVAAAVVITVAAVAFTVFTFGTGAPISIVMGAGISALCGVGGQVISDVIAGEKSSFRDFAAVFIGGAIDGAISTAGLVLAGPVGAKLANGFGGIAGKLVEGGIKGDSWREMSGTIIGGGVTIGLSFLLPKSMSKVAEKTISKGVGSTVGKFSSEMLSGESFGMSIQNAIVKGAFDAAATGITTGLSERFKTKMEFQHKENVRAFEAGLIVPKEHLAKSLELVDGERAFNTGIIVVPRDTMNKIIINGFKTDIMKDFISDTTKGTLKKLFTPIPVH